MVGGGLGVFTPAPCRAGDDDGDEVGGSAGLLFVPACVPIPVPFIMPTPIPMVADGLGVSVTLMVADGLGVSVTPMVADGLGVSVTSIVTVVACGCAAGKAARVMVDSCMIVDSIES